ncbi:TON1 Recruiting Motif 26 [Hibiscus trionum]|uniref:TON1 Recruiting Motif 26 n=1 Tax=Hibiscus trionum TaxID=183268 RepID=A0A9W7GZB0_HIBTR|nr:TON1 Recruiting Motif 26 [Hibiscus trionum]
MGGLFHFFDFNQGNMARKILAHKRHVGGVDAPRNSLELQLESSQTYCAVDDLPHSYQVEEDWAAKYYCQTEASMKKLINEEMTRQSNTRQNAPSVVARLMGMDVLPLDTKSVVLQSVEKKNDNQQVKFCKREKNAKGSDVHLASDSTYSKKMDMDTVYGSRDSDAERWSTSQKYGKPKPREHPQEEELQKFKKEFEAWQAARLRECPKVVDVGSISMAQEKLSKEKMSLYADSERTKHEKTLESKRFAVKENLHNVHLHHHRHKSADFIAEQKESRRRCTSKDIQLPSMICYNEKVDAAPTRIVILKPGPDRIYDHEESWTGSSDTFDERPSIEDFLEEVKERLKLELQGKTLVKSSVVRGSGIETPFSEKPSDPRQIAMHIAKQVRENVSRDLEMKLVRSESTKSYRSSVQFNGPGSPEFINRDMRKFLSERLKNVQKQETVPNIPVVSTGSSRASVSDNGRDRLKQIQDMPKSGNEQSYWEIVKDEQEMQTRSFRHGDDAGLLNREPSSGNLVRSLSAPVSGTSLGKLLLEDRHILTGAQIRRKHEGIENVPVDFVKRKKERFNLKERVSNIKYGLTLRRRLFGRKIQSMLETYGAHDGPAKDTLSGPTVINFSERHENSTEVPPSPASVCSSTNEEFWRQVDYLSPISTPDVSFGEENAVPQVFKEISSNLNELRRQLNELESDGADDISVEHDSSESEIGDLEDQSEGYVRDLLVASGLFDGSCDKSFSRWEPLAKPIGDSVFEHVEESYRKSGKENDSSRNDADEKKVDRKVLLDLSNEALSTILGPPVTMSRFRRKLLGCSTLPPPRGRKLLNSVWDIIQTNLYPPNNRCHYSLDSMVAWDLRSTPWSGLIDDEINVLGREVECHIIRDLVQEIVKDIHS